MKRLFVFMLMACLPVVLAAQTQHLHFKVDGATANISMLSPDNLSGTNLFVSRTSGNIAAPTAVLNYFAFSVAPDFSSETFVQIVGEFPASEFKAENTQRLVLDFDTNTLDPSNSILRTCVLNLITFLPPDCTPGEPAGVIHLEFQENGALRTRVLNSDVEIMIGSTTIRMHQNSDTSTANVQGTIFGVPFTFAGAQVGVNQNSTLEVIKN